MVVIAVWQIFQCSPTQRESASEGRRRSGDPLPIFLCRTSLPENRRKILRQELTELAIVATIPPSFVTQRCLLELKIRRETLMSPGEPNLDQRVFLFGFLFRFGGSFLSNFLPRNPCGYSKVWCRKHFVLFIDSFCLLYCCYNHYYRMTYQNHDDQLEKRATVL